MILNEPNPFRPGAGRVPPLLAGRQPLLEAFDRRLQEASSTGEGDRPWLLTGLRGVGKTVLLNQLALQAARAGWPTVKVEAQSGKSLTGRLTQELYVSLRKLVSGPAKSKEAIARLLSVFRSFQVRVDPGGSYTFGFDVQPAAGVADSGNLAVDMTELLTALGDAARAEGLGVLLAVDELQEGPKDDLDALNIALHQIGQSPSPVPVLFVGAGLPSLPAVLADATSYAERLYLITTVTTLTRTQTEDALVIPSRAAKVTWSPEALNLAVEESRGYPYFVQATGRHCWDVATARTIGAADARIGLLRAREEVDSGLYWSRWERATQAQQEFMTAMAQDGADPSAIADLAVRMGKKVTALSPTRSQLIASGLIYAPRRGVLAFTVPGMDQYIDRLKISPHPAGGFSR